MHSNHSSSRVLTACQQGFLEVLIIQVLSDEDHLAEALLVVSEGLVAGAEVDLLVYTLEHKLHITLVSKSQDAFSAIEISRLSLQ